MSSYTKVSPENRSYRPSRPRKKHFRGNQFSDESDQIGPNTSKKKLLTASSETLPVVQIHCYRIIQFVSVFTVLSDLLICRECKQNVTFSEANYRGLGFKILLSCRCGRQEINSGPFINNAYEINRRIVFFMRLLGIARERINLFCNLMDLGSEISKNAYSGILQHIYNASKLVFEYLCKKAVEEEKRQNIERERSENILKVSGDGTWKKRGFSSHYGITILIGYYSGKVIDLVKGSFCQSCLYWKSKKK